jgi:thiamine kinase-like enzyme
MMILNFCHEAGYCGRNHIYLTFQNGRGYSLKYIFFSSKILELVKNLINIGNKSIYWMKFPLKDAKIFIKNNARLIYANPNSLSKEVITAKIYLPSKYRKERLSKEIDAKLFLNNKKLHDFHPKLLNYDKKQNNWIIEKYIQPDKNIDISLKLELFINKFASKYYLPGIYSSRIIDFLKDNDISLTQLKKLIPFDFQFSSSATWPYSNVHGDLSFGNMILSKQNKIYIIDWELSKRGPIALDLVNLYLDTTHIGKMNLVNLLDSLSSCDDLDSKKQIKVAMAIYFLQNERDKEIKKNYFKRHLGLNQFEANQLMKKLQNRIQKSFEL